MKHRNTSPLFKIFKRDYTHDITFFKRFNYWFKNIYWYHYKKQTLLILSALILFVVFLCDIINKEYYDLAFIVGGNSMVESESLTELSEILKQNIDDTNNDGKININHQMLYTGTVREKPEEGQVFDEILSVSVQKIQLSFADDDVLLFILDKDFADWYAADGAFEPLESFGILSENKYCIRIDQTKLFKELNIINPDGWYAGIKVKNKNRTKNPAALKRYTAAETALKTILK